MLSETSPGGSEVNFRDSPQFGFHPPPTLCADPNAYSLHPSHSCMELRKYYLQMLVVSMGNGAGNRLDQPTRVLDAAHPSANPADRRPPRQQALRRPLNQGREIAVRETFVEFPSALGRSMYDESGVGVCQWRGRLGIIGAIGDERSGLYR